MDKVAGRMLMHLSLYIQLCVLKLHGHLTKINHCK